MPNKEPGPTHHFQMACILFICLAVICLGSRGAKDAEGILISPDYSRLVKFADAKESLLRNLTALANLCVSQSRIYFDSSNLMLTVANEELRLNLRAFIPEITLISRPLSPDHMQIDATIKLEKFPPASEEDIARRRHVVFYQGEIFKRGFSFCEPVPFAHGFPLNADDHLINIPEVLYLNRPGFNERIRRYQAGFHCQFIYQRIMKEQPVNMGIAFGRLLARYASFASLYAITNTPLKRADSFSLFKTRVLAPSGKVLHLLRFLSDYTQNHHLLLMVDLSDEANDVKWNYNGFGILCGNNISYLHARKHFTFLSDRNTLDQWRSDASCFIAEETFKSPIPFSWDCFCEYKGKEEKLIVDILLGYTAEIKDSKPELFAKLHACLDVLIQ